MLGGRTAARDDRGTRSRPADGALAVPGPGSQRSRSRLSWPRSSRRPWPLKDGGLVAALRTSRPSARASSQPHGRRRVDAGSRWPRPGAIERPMSERRTSDWPPTGGPCAKLGRGRCHRHLCRDRSAGDAAQPPDAGAASRSWPTSVLGDVPPPGMLQASTGGHPRGGGRSYPSRSPCFARSSPWQRVHPDVRLRDAGPRLRARILRHAQRLSVLHHDAKGTADAAYYGSCGRQRDQRDRPRRRASRSRSRQSPRRPCSPSSGPSTRS